MTFEDFKQDIFENIQALPLTWRRGQKVFNYIDKKYGIAREVQFKHGVDCFYRDEYIDDFIKKAYDVFKSLYVN